MSRRRKVLRSVVTKPAAARVENPDVLRMGEIAAASVRVKQARQVVRREMGL